MKQQVSSYLKILIIGLCLFAIMFSTYVFLDYRGGLILSDSTSTIRNAIKATVYSLAITGLIFYFEKYLNLESYTEQYRTGYYLGLTVFFALLLLSIFWLIWYFLML